MQRMSGRINGGWIVAALVIVAVAAAVVAILQLDTTGETGSGLSQAYAYDLSLLAKIDPNLILYAESGPAIHTGFSQSRAIALDATGRVFVAGDRGIRVFSSAEAPEQVMDLAGEPQCLTIHDDGTIYVGMKDHVEVLDAQGRSVASWDPLGDEAVLTSIARHKDSIFVADAGHRIVLHYDTAGTLIDHIGGKDPDRNIPGFFVPSPHFDLAVSRDGMLRVVDPGRNRIDTFTLEGDLEFWWGERSVGIKGFCGCCNPVSFALLPDGGFVTAEKGLVRVKVYNSDGGFVGVVAGPDQFAGGKQMKVCETPEECQGTALDVAAGADGRIYVLDPADNTVKVFSKRISGTRASMGRVGATGYLPAVDGRVRITHRSIAGIVASVEERWCVIRTLRTGGSAPRPLAFSALSQQHVGCASHAIAVKTACNPHAMRKPPVVVVGCAVHTDVQLDALEMVCTAHPTAQQSPALRRDGLRSGLAVPSCYWPKASNGDPKRDISRLGTHAGGSGAAPPRSTMDWQLGLNPSCRGLVSRTWGVLNNCGVSIECRGRGAPQRETMRWGPRPALESWTGGPRHEHSQTSLAVAPITPSSRWDTSFRMKEVGS